ncbi:MAG: hypothetical protein ABI624_21955 [Casimicrobiaceae bacterium]
MTTASTCRGHARTALLALLLAFVASGALAQTPAADAAPAARLPRLPSLPDPSALPDRPPDIRLPGPDPRQCGDTKWSALCPVGRWTDFANIELHVKAPEFTGDYTMEQPANGELHTTYREQAGKDRRGGEIVVVGESGFAYRSRESFPKDDAIIDYMLSSPLMMTKLAVVLLDLGVLGAPADVVKAQPITASNSTQFIRTEAPRIAALYGPPWNMTGTVRPAGDRKVAFSMRLRFHPVDAKGKVDPATTDTVELQGTVSYAPKRATMPDTFDLVGWQLIKNDARIAGVADIGAAREAMK